MNTQIGGDSTAYGAAFADVYDAWYEDVTDVTSTVDTLVRLAGGGNLLELGVGTGRIAVPLAERLGHNARIVGIDSSIQMLEIWRAKLSTNARASAHSRVVHGDMTLSFKHESLRRESLDHGPFSVIFCTFNTFFNLPTHDAQRGCLANAAAALAPGGAIVLEFAVFRDDIIGATPSEVTESRTRRDGSMVTSTSRIDPSDFSASGVFIDDTERSREWHIRWATPRMIEEMGAAAGLVCTDRWEDFSRAPFRDASVRQVCVMRRRLTGT